MNALGVWAFRDLSYMISDKDLIVSMLETDEKNLAKYITVNKDGSITIGKTAYRWINKLFGCEKTINIETLCLRLIKLITGYGGGRNDQAYTDLCQRFSEYYKDGNYSLAISAIFAAYRFVLAPDIKTLSSNSSKVENRNCNNSKVECRNNIDVSLHGVIVKDGSGQAVIVDFSNPRQILFRRP